MKRKILGVLMLIFCLWAVLQLSGCRSMQQNNWLIYDKIPMGSGADSCMCAYFFQRPSTIGINPLPNSSYAVDSCHKYRVGDDWWWLQHKIKPIRP